MKFIKLHESQTNEEVFVNPGKIVYLKRGMEARFTQVCMTDSSERVKETPKEIIAQTRIVGGVSE